MKSKLIKSIVFTASLLFVGFVGVQAQTLLNGDFEDNLPTFPSSGFVIQQPYAWGAITATPYIIQSWDGQSASAAFKLAAQHGGAFIGLQNNTSVANPTGIYQTVNGFEIGEEYTVSFYVRARNTASAGGTFTANISGGTNAQIISGNAVSDDWMFVTGNFIAASTSAQLGISFRSSSGDQMLFIDNVKVVPAVIPEANASIVFVGIVSLILAGWKLRARHG